MRKGLAMLLALSLALIAPALAEAEGYWTNNEDIYYHALENCGGVEGRVPISLEGAAEFEKYPCPVCVPDEDDGDEPTAAARYSVIVVRFSDSWLAKQELTGVFGFMGEAIYEGAEAERMRAELLHGEAYANFPEDGTQVWALAPDLLEQDGDEALCTLLCRRHIGSAWYVILLPTQRFGDSWEMYWRVNADQVWMEGGALHTCFERQTVEEHRALKLALLHGSEPEYSRDGEPEVRVYQALDTHVAVIYESDPDENLLQDVELRIGGEYAGTMQGRLQDGRAIYYSALTEGEMNALRNGAAVELARESPAEGADFSGTPYAAAVYGSSERMGIVDRDGNWVVQPEYDFIYRQSAEEAHATTPTPFFCNRKGGGSVILDGDTLEVLFECERNACYENPAVFREIGDASAFWAGESCIFRSLADGSALFEYAGQEACGWWPDAGYRVLAEGEPQRMVAVKGDGADAQMSLIDNRGESIPGVTHQRITPLYWKGERGVFLAEKFDPGQYVGAGFGENRTTYDLSGGAYDGRACYGSDWRCGLIDEDGSALTEMKYVSIACSTDGTISLIGEDGSIETLTLDALLGEGA